MNDAEVKAIVANPYVSPEDLVKHYLSNPLYLEEWLRDKGKALAGMSNDCSQCVVAAYLQEALTEANWEFNYLNVSYCHAWLCIEKEEVDIKLPQWIRDFIRSIDAHGNSYQETNKHQRIFSGNLAANILKVTLESGVE